MLMVFEPVMTYDCKVMQAKQTAWPFVLPLLNLGVIIMFELKNPRGTKDYLPEEQRIRRDILRKLESIFESYGYQPLETPILCLYEVLASKYAGGAEILKEVYKLKDQGNRDLGLRYDLTIPFSKVVGMNPDLRMPFKRYEIGKVFRDGPVKTGRFREFTQCDVDMVGVESQIAEAEIISMTVDAFAQMGLDVYVSYNNRKFLAGLLQCISVEEGLVNDVILTLDKVGKITQDEVKIELAEKGVSEEVADKILSVFQMSRDDLNFFIQDNLASSLLKQGYDELKDLDGYIEALGLQDKTRFNPFLARGLDIYTGTVFEVFLQDGSITSSLGAGGRYDRIIGAFLEDGNDYPAVGISFGLDVIFKALELRGELGMLRPCDLFIIPLGTKLESLKIANSLRKMGIRVDIEMMDRKLKKSLEYADKGNVPFTVVIGEDELNTGVIKIKDMANSTEETVQLDKLGEKIKERLENRP